MRHLGACDIASTDAVNLPAIGDLATLKSLEQHAVGVILLDSIRTPHYLGRRLTLQNLTNSRIGQVSLTRRR